MTLPAIDPQGLFSAAAINRPPLIWSRKHTPLLSAARELFFRDGYDGTSMDAVARKANVSKSTLYAHFASKDALFVAVVEEARESLQTSMAGISDSVQGDVTKLLRQIGLLYLRFITRPESLCLLRIVISASRQFPSISRDIVQSSVTAVVDLVAHQLSKCSGAGKLAVADPRVAARHFIALIKSDLHLRCLLDPDNPVHEEDIASYVDTAIPIFLKCYRSA